MHDRTSQELDLVDLALSLSTLDVHTSSVSCGVLAHDSRIYTGRIRNLLCNMQHGFDYDSMHTSDLIMVSSAPHLSTGGEGK